MKLHEQVETLNASRLRVHIKGSHARDPSRYDHLSNPSRFPIQLKSHHRGAQRFVKLPDT